MPQWGRPPGVWQGKQTRRKATQWEDHDGVRFEEIESDDDDGYNGVAFVDSSGRPRRTGNSGGQATARALRLRSNGYDYESEISDGADFDLDDDADSTVAYAVQLAMRDKEDMLVDKALERIRRAQMLGKKNVRLSQEELDALERRRKGTTGKKSAATIAASSTARVPSMNDKRPKSKESLPKTSPRTSTASEWRRSVQEQYSPNEYSGIPIRPPSGYHPSVNNSPTSSSSRPRTPTMQSLRPLAPTGSPLMHQSVYMQRYPSEREPPSVRSLPDDPKWAPRQRSQSNVLPYPDYNPAYAQQQYGAGYFDPRYGNLQGRRYAPEPSSFNPTHMPMPVPEDNHRRDSGRRIPKESSEDESSEDSEEDDDDDDDDEGVQVEVVAQPPTARTSAARTVTASSGGGTRGSRGTRRRRGR